MLRNPKLDAAQRAKIVAMKERRVAKEAALESSMTELVRTSSPATQAALREAMGGLEAARRAAGFGAPPATASVAPAPGESVTALVRTASAATQEALRQSMEELAEYKRSQGLAWGAPEPEPEQAATSQSLTSLMRTASPAAHAALQQSMRELAEVKRAIPHQSSSPRDLPVEPDDGDSLKRQFSTEMYDKMLKNPKLSAEQRKKIEAMRTRRQAKEGASTATMTVRSFATLHKCMPSSCCASGRDCVPLLTGLLVRRACVCRGEQALVRQASPAVQDALRESMRGLDEAKRAAGFTGGSTTSDMPRTASAVSRATGISKASIAEVIKMIPSFTVGDLRTLYTKFSAHVTAADGFLPQQTFSAVRLALVVERLKFAKAARRATCQN
jgi:hypothetical protein